MRTYSRKKPECQLLEDVQELCRLCLTKSDYVVPIFDSKTETQYTPLALRIMICVGIEVTREENFPNVVCKDCYQELQRFTTFRKKCEVSYMRLKAHLNAIKENMIKEKALQKCDKQIETEVMDTELDESNSSITIQFENSKPGIEIETREDVQMAQTINEDNDSMQNEVLSQDVEIKVQSDEQCPSPDISAFLSMVLLELGILTQKGDNIGIANTKMRSLTLVTGDKEVALELMEEDDEEEDIQIYYEENEEDDQTDVASQDNILIQYVDDNNSTEDKEEKEDNDISNKIGSHWCGWCGARFRWRSSLARHVTRHTGLRPHACDRCPKRFAQRGVMMRHRLLHDEVRPFQCGECPRSFSQQAALRAHARSHRPPQRQLMALHRCLRCPKLFLYASGLSRHMLCHKGRMFSCSTCGRLFSDHSSIRRHLKKTGHHQDEPSPNPTQTQNT